MHVKLLLFFPIAPGTLWGGEFCCSHRVKAPGAPTWSRDLQVDSWEAFSLVGCATLFQFWVHTMPINLTIINYTIFGKEIFLRGYQIPLIP